MFTDWSFPHLVLHYIFYPVSYSGPFKNVHIKDHSRFFICWTISEFSHYGSFKFIQILEPLKSFLSLTIQDFFTFQTFPLLSLPGPFKNLGILEHIKFLTIWTNPELSRSGMFKTWTIPKFHLLNHSMIFYMINHFRILGYGEYMRYAQDMFQTFLRYV